jgi:aminoglycoside 2'-N-acetyltransferase I
VRIRVRDRAEYSREELDELRGWLEVAYDDGPWRPEHWDDLGPGPHVVAEDTGGALLAHACIAWVPIEIGGIALPAGYLEDVATRQDVRGLGHGSAVVAAAQELIEADADIGFLATGSVSFYERLGWIRWQGPSAVRESDGAITPTPEEDGNIMALRFERTPGWVSADQPIVRPRRDPEEAW